MKTEIVVFHRFDTSGADIKVRGVVVKSLSVLKFLGILFDNRVQWDRQVENAIMDIRRTLQGRKIIKKHFTKKELVRLITSMYYSKLYCGSQVWLLPTLQVKESLYSKLFSQSGRCLKTVDKEASFMSLHKKYS